MDADLVRTVLVTVLLVIGLLGAFAGAGRVSPGVRVTAYAGFWAGVFLIGILEITSDAVRDELVGLLARVDAVSALVVGLLVGAAVVASFAILRGSRSVGVVFVVQTFVAGTGLLLYARAGDGTRTTVALLTLGAAVGICLTFFVPRRYVVRFLDWRADRTQARRAALRARQTEREREREQRVQRWVERRARRRERIRRLLIVRRDRTGSRP